MQQKFVADCLGVYVYVCVYIYIYFNACGFRFPLSDFIKKHNTDLFLL